MAALSRHVAFPSGGELGVQLEGVLALPPTAAKDARCPAAILCHPQPIASSLHDPLLVQLEFGLLACGFVTLRFNFRGVGASQGESTDGRLEPLDIAGAVSYLLEQPEVNPDKLCLVGHAYGASMALAYARYDPRVRTVVAVSPPLFRSSGDLAGFDRPALFVTAEYDEVCPQFKLAPLLAGLPRVQGLHVVPGARHLLRGYESAASGIVTQYLATWAATPGG
ncbi:MAG TPA: alpha/beta fold hydrolase [Ktedonobacterales bacterium]